MLTEGKDVIVNNHSLSDEGASPFDSIAAEPNKEHSGQLLVVAGVVGGWMTAGVIAR